MIQRIVAPFMPFLAEKLYQNLGTADDNAEESIHLTQWPVPDASLYNEALVNEMEVVQTVVGLGRSCRGREPRAGSTAAVPDPGKHTATRSA